jgi:hypothetical protein
MVSLSNHEGQGRVSRFQSFRVLLGANAAWGALLRPAAKGQGAAKLYTH